jgi:hypothetical protein
MQTPPSPAHTRGSPADPAHSAQVVNARIGSKGQAGNPADTRPRNSQMRPPLRSLPKSWDGVPKSKNTPHKATKAPTEYGAARPLSRLRASARHQRHNFQRLPWHRPGGRENGTTTRAQDARPTRRLCPPAASFASPGRHDETRRLRKYIEIFLALPCMSHMGKGSVWRGSLAAPRYNRLDVKPRFHSAEDHIFSPGSKNAAYFSRTDPLRKYLRKDWSRQPRILIAPLTRFHSGLR